MWEVVVAGVAAGLTAPGAVLSMMQAAEMSDVSMRQVSNLIRRIKVTAMDKILRDMMNRTGEKYSIFMGTLDPMSDNLIAEALAAGISVPHIAHAIFSCEKSSDWLRGKLNRLLPLGKVSPMLKVLHLGVPIPHTEFAKALVDRMASEKAISWNQSKENQVLDLNRFNKVDEFHYQSNMKATLYADGCVAINGNRIISAMVPRRHGVDYYLHEDSYEGETKGQYPHLAEEIVADLVLLGCSPVIAWRIIACVDNFRVTKDDFRKCISVSFKVVSQFRSAIMRQLETLKTNKRVMGTRQELKILLNCHGQEQKQQELQAEFQPDTALYSAAQCMDFEQLLPFGEEIFDSDPLETNMEIIARLIEQAKDSELNRNRAEGRSRFNARTIAVLGAFDGKEVYGGVISNHVKAQYFYQDDDETKSLCTAFSQMMMFSTINYVDIRFEGASQYFSNYHPAKLSDWLALRAAHEFDTQTSRFKYETDSFRVAEDLINESVASFIHDNKRRFAQAFQDAPEKIYVSHLRELSQQIARRTGASSAWLLREFVSRYIEYGAQIENVGQESNDSYGKLEQLIKANSSGSSEKRLVFDCKVNIEGITCEVKQKGRVFLIGPVTEQYDGLLKSTRGEVHDRKTAFSWLERGWYDAVEAVPRERSPLGLRIAAAANLV